MNIINSIKNLYKGENKIAIHISVFALAGIVAIAFVNIASLFLGHSIYSIFSVPKDQDAIMYSIIGIMIFIFFTGYKYKYANLLFKDENTELPSISMDCFAIFAKIFPVIFLWGTYAFLFFVLLGTIFGIIAIKGIIPILFTIFLIPFINAVIILFSEKFEYRAIFANPIFIFKIIKKTFKPIILWLIQFAILYVIVLICFKYLFNYGFTHQTRLYQLISTLFLTCLSGYVQEIIYLAYINGIVKILKENYIKQP